MSDCRAQSAMPDADKGDMKRITKKNSRISKCKITVLKTSCYHALYKKYRGIRGQPCPAFHKGQEIIISECNAVPEGFCCQAWTDIQPYVKAVYHNHEEIVITYCTDKFRPVLFKLEKIIK